MFTINSIETSLQQSHSHPMVDNNQHLGLGDSFAPNVGAQRNF